MAAAVRQDLAQLMNSSGSHKDLAGKWFFRPAACCLG
uniref:COP9 signalosome subunit 4 n=1 Tax=Mus musculus TaxID=10090 RepID=D6RG47_MOUSE